MAYPFSTLQTQVRLKVNNTSADVTEAIDEAINLLSCFFWLNKIDTSIDTVANQAYISKPSRCLSVARVIVDSVEYEKVSIKDLKDADEYSKKTWIDYNGAIQLTPTPDGAKDTIIWYRSAFTPLAGSGSTDVPDHLVPLLIILAAWFYYTQMLMQVGTARENFPDMDPEEAIKLSSEIKKEFDAMLASIQSQHI